MCACSRPCILAGCTIKQDVALTCLHSQLASTSLPAASSSTSPGSGSGTTPSMWHSEGAGWGPGTRPAGCCVPYPWLFEVPHGIQAMQLLLDSFIPAAICIRSFCSLALVSSSLQLSHSPTHPPQTDRLLCSCSCVVC